MSNSKMERRFATAWRVVALAPAVLAAGCATMFSGGPDLVPVSSSPEGAKVSLDGFAVGRTPCTVAIDRTSEGMIKVEAPGYAPAVVDREKVLNGWFLVDLISPWLIGFPIDLITSNQGKYSTTPVFVELSPVTPSH